MSKHTKYFNKFCALSCCVRLIPLPYSFVSFDRYVQINASWGWKTSVRGQCTTVLYYSGFPKGVNLVIIIIIIIIIINSLTARVVRAPQMILLPVFSIFSLFSTALWDLPNSRPVHSLMLSSHRFLCLPCLLPRFTVPCKIVFSQT